MTILLALCALVTAPIAEDSARHPWPFEPATRAHEISNHFCAPLRFGEVRGYLHGGIDIRKPAGTPVLAVATGTVWIYREKHLDNLVLTEPNGDSWEYRHLFADRIPAAVRHAHERGLLVEAGTVIGEVAPWGLGYAHLHFNHRKGDGTIVDPLSVLLPLPDDTPPVIDQVLILPADRATPYPSEKDGRVVIAGEVDVVAIASDRIAVERWKHSPRRAAADLIDHAGKERRLATWQPFDRQLPLPLQLPVPRYPRGSGLEAYLRFGPLATDNPIPVPSPQRFSIVITDGTAKGADQTRTWDTRTIADGEYTLRVSVEDAAGLSAQTSVAIEVRNAAPPRLPLPPLAEKLEKSLATHRFATCFAGDRVEQVFRVPHTGCEGEWDTSARTEIVEISVVEETCQIAIQVDTEGLFGTRTFRAKPLALPSHELKLEVEIHPLFEVAPRPRLRLDSAGDPFVQVRLRTPAATVCREIRWSKGNDAGVIDVSHASIDAPTLHCMTIETKIPREARGGSLHCPLESLGRSRKMEIAIPSEVRSEEF